MYQEDHVDVVRGWIDANIEEGCESLDDVLKQQTLFQHEGKSWLCAVTDLEGQFKLYLEMFNYIDEYDLPYEFEMLLMKLSDFWQLVSVEHGIHDPSA